MHLLPCVHLRRVLRVRVLERRRQEAVRDLPAVVVLLTVERRDLPAVVLVLLLRLLAPRIRLLRSVLRLSEVGGAELGIMINWYLSVNRCKQYVQGAAHQTPGTLRIHNRITPGCVSGSCRGAAACSRCCSRSSSGRRVRVAPNY